MPETITREEIIESIRKRSTFYDKNIFCVENTVTHTLNYLEDKKFIKLRKLKREKAEKEKVEIFFDNPTPNIERTSLTQSLGESGISNNSSQIEGDETTSVLSDTNKEVQEDEEVFPYGTSMDDVGILMKSKDNSQQPEEITCQGEGEFTGKVYNSGHLGNGKPKEYPSADKEVQEGEKNAHTTN